MTIKLKRKLFFFYIKWNMVIDQNVLKVLFILFGWKPGGAERAHISWWWLLTASPVFASARCSFSARTDTFTYDICLSFIQYLGENLVELRGRTLLDDGSVQRLPLLPQLGVVLVPGQTLPLMVFYPPTISMLRNIITTNGTFGVICVRYEWSSKCPVT